MQITLTTKRQATFPISVCEAMKIQPGDRLEIIPGTHEEEWVIRPARIRESNLAPLAGMIKKGLGTFELNTFRNSPKDHAKLRD